MCSNSKFLNNDSSLSMANADVPSDYCLMTTLERGNSQEIDRASKLDDTIIIAHHPFQGSKVKCDDGFEEEILHNSDVGVLRVFLGSGCRITLHSRVIASSHRMVCENTSKLSTLSQFK
jgi:hypothetical protein